MRKDILLKNRLPDNSINEKNDNYKWLLYVYMKCMGSHTSMRFKTAKEKGRIVNKDGYHQCRNCYCSLTTRKGAYRDITIELDGKELCFYHQSLIVIKNKDNSYELNSHGYRTKTTKERINRYIPSGFRVYQEDFTWYVSKPDGKVQEFKDGMIIREDK